MSETAASLVLVAALGLYGLWLHWFLARQALAIVRISRRGAGLDREPWDGGGCHGAAFAGQSISDEFGFNV